MDYLVFILKLLQPSGYITINGYAVRRMWTGHFWVQCGADVYCTTNPVHAFQACHLNQFTQLYAAAKK